MPPTKVKCPKCGRELAASGVLDLDGVEAPVYQCDECLVKRTTLGVEMELALTFCIDANGRAFYPPDPDAPLF